MGSDLAPSLKRSFWTKGTTALSPSSSIATPRTVNPCGSYFSCKSISHGISILHGPHHVAQKFTRTTLRLNWPSDLSRPSRSLNAKSGTLEVALACLLFSVRASEVRSPLPANYLRNTITVSTATGNPIRFIPNRSSSRISLALKGKSIQEPQLSREPGQFIDENQAAYKQE